ncbi:MAG: universal stress protein [Archangium sp.]|nr:universal stress protein [Archangium sp.]
MPSRNPLSSVVVPTDFSEGSQQALTRALRLPLGPKSKVTLLHVVPDDIPGTLRKQAILEAERNLEKALKQVHQLAIDRGLLPRQFVADVVEGDSEAQILKRAHTVEADVICMGRHGRTSLVELRIGSTARKVVKRGDVPVLLVRAPATRTYQSALIAVDLTLASAKVIKTARPYVEDASDVEVLHASSVPFEDYVVVSGDRAEEFRDEALKGATKDLKALVAKSGLKAETRVLGGDARLLIIEEAKVRKAELIIVGTHGRKGVRKLILGSVAEWIMTHATCDVLVTRG